MLRCHTSILSHVALEPQRLAGRGRPGARPHSPWPVKRAGCRYRPPMYAEGPGGRTESPYDGAVRLLEDTDWEWRRRGPTPRAVHAFGVREDALLRLPGGAGHAWTDGRLVLKPVGCVPEHAWVCEVYAAWDSKDVRVPEPVVPRDGAEVGWSTDGWGAHVFLPGRDVDLVRELARVKDASDAFHHSVKALPRPAFMDIRDDPWAFGDRLAWEAAEPEGDDETLDVIGQLKAKLAPVASSRQVIHGDILPNVLVADGLPPRHRLAALLQARWDSQRGSRHRCRDLSAGTDVPTRRVGDRPGLAPIAGPRPSLPTRPDRTLRLTEPVDGQPGHARRTGTTRRERGPFPLLIWFPRTGTTSAVRR